MRRLAFACRDAEPASESEPGQSALATARALAADHEVTLFASARSRGTWGEWDAGDLRVVFVEEPEQLGGFLSHDQHYSALLLDALRQAYGPDGPDYVEVPDRGGEGAAVVQARLTRDPFLQTTRVAVRSVGTDEMVRVLDGWLPDDADTHLRHELERICLRHADVRLLPAATVGETYARFYADEQALAPARVVRPAVDAHPAAVARPPLAGRPLQLLFAGALDARSGIQTLVEALLGLDCAADAWRLTIAGTDRRSGGLGTSMRELLELAIAGDPRIDLAPEDCTTSLAERIAEHDVLVVPSRWGCWPPSALQALHANRPLLATPTGGLCELAVPGRSGWRSTDTSAQGVATAVEHVLDHPHELEALVRERGPERVAQQLDGVGAVGEAYEVLLDELPASRSAPPRRERVPLVSVVIPYFRHAPYVERAVASAFAQTHPALEVFVVNDGSAEPGDAVLQELATRWPIVLLTQENQGVGAARNLGIAQAAGRYVLPLDADNELEPSFVARAVATLEAEPGLAWVSSWSTFVDERSEPLGGGNPGYSPTAGRGPELERHNVAADAAALIRRHVFELGFRYRTDLVSLEDWLLYRELRDAGYHGAIIPERLLRYRVLATSKLRTFGMAHTERLEGELRAHQRSRRMLWTPAAADEQAATPPAEPPADQPADRLRSLERANAELRRTNARLGRSLPGHAGAAAVARAATAERNAAQAEAEARQSAPRERCTIRFAGRIGRLLSTPRD